MLVYGFVCEVCFLMFYWQGLVYKDWFSRFSLQDVFLSLFFEIWFARLGTTGSVIEGFFLMTISLQGWV